tara:strand:+ start:6547 stop:7341 length:795 start_codon:yes stop_codon:yes gene_type:complete
MANYTLTYSEGSKGFPSFYSYVPDFMIGMNNYLYSFKNGQLYRHNTNETRNSYYGVNYSSSIKTVINENPLDNKLFKTLNLESTDAWSAEILTDVAAQSSSITNTSFVKKEGNYFAYVRTNGATAGGTLTESDFKSRANGGVGEATSFAGGGGGGTISFALTIELNSQMSIGDAIYAGSGSTLAFVGVLTSTTVTNTQNQINLNLLGGTYTPVAGDFVMYFKNAQAESLGVMGHYAEVTLTLPDTVTTASELFAIESELMKSYP